MKTTRGCARLITTLLTGVSVLVASTAVQAADTLAQMKTSRQITMGVRESSGALSYYVGTTGEHVGFQVDLCNRILADIQKDLGLDKLEVKRQTVTAQNRIPLLTNGTIDIECGSTANTQARQRDVAFSYTTFVEATRIAVKAASGIERIEQLAGKRVATTVGTTSVQTLRKHKKAQGASFDEVMGKDHAESFLLLETDRADAFVMDGQVLAGLIAGAKNPADFKIIGEPLAQEPVAIVFRKDDAAFGKAVNDALKGMFANGEVNKLYRKWFEQPIPPKNVTLNLPASTATMKAWSSPNQHSVEELMELSR